MDNYYIVADESAWTLSLITKCSGRSHSRPPKESTKGGRKKRVVFVYGFVYTEIEWKRFREISGLTRGAVSYRGGLLTTALI